MEGSKREIYLPVGGSSQDLAVSSKREEESHLPAQE